MKNYDSSKPYFASHDLGGVNTGNVHNIGAGGTNILGSACCDGVSSKRKAQWNKRMDRSIGINEFEHPE